MTLYKFEFEEISDTKNNPLLKKFIFQEKLALIYGFTINFNSQEITGLIMPSLIPTCDLYNDDLISSFNNYIETEKISIKHGNTNYEIALKTLWNNRFELCKAINSVKLPFMLFSGIMMKF